MQYVGDTKVHAAVWEALTGDRRHTRNALRDFHRSRNAEGVLKSCYPLRYNFYHSSYSLIWVDMLADYVERSGDTAFVRPYLGGVLQTMGYFNDHYNPETGFLNVPYRPFVDWYDGGRGGLGPGQTSETSVALALQYAHALRSARRLLAYQLADAGPVTGARLVATHREYGMRLEHLRERLTACCYDETRELFYTTPGRERYDQHANTLASLVGFLDDDRSVLPTAVLVDTTFDQASYYFRYYLLEALRRGDSARDTYLQPERVHAVLAPWRDLVRRGATTVAERFEGASKPSRSEAHPWSAAPTLFAYTLLAGIDSAHGDTIRMAPAFGPLREMRGYYPVRGVGRGVHFDLRLVEGELRGEVRAEGVPVEVVGGGAGAGGRGGGVGRW